MFSPSYQKKEEHIEFAQSLNLRLKLKIEEFIHKVKALLWVIMIWVLMGE